MKKEELLLFIRESMKREESATTIYLGHLNAIVARSGLSPHEIGPIKEVIGKLIDSNKKHKAVLLELERRIEGEERDVF